MPANVPDEGPIILPLRVKALVEHVLDEVARSIGLEELERFDAERKKKPKKKNRYT